MKILMVDDHALIREALRGVLKELMDDAAVLEAPNCGKAMQHGLTLVSEKTGSERIYRTTPARNPRTECACQPVASMMAAMVVPFGGPNSASTACCFDPRVW
jgi:hypothetical protein